MKTINTLPGFFHESDYELRMLSSDPSFVKFPLAWETLRNEDMNKMDVYELDARVKFKLNWTRYFNQNRQLQKKTLFLQFLANLPWNQIFFK